MGLVPPSFRTWLRLWTVWTQRERDRSVETLVLFFVLCGTYVHQNSASRSDYNFQRRFPYNDISFHSGDIRDPEFGPKFDVFGPSATAALFSSCNA